ncbi:hypothetical protein [Parashewanella curva]|nr:hypothetical protein [Parashewanella curva]
MILSNNANERDREQQSTVECELTIAEQAIQAMRYQLGQSSIASRYNKLN